MLSFSDTTIILNKCALQQRKDSPIVAKYAIKEHHVSNHNSHASTWDVPINTWSSQLPRLCTDTTKGETTLGCSKSQPIKTSVTFSKAPFGKRSIYMLLVFRERYSKNLGIWCFLFLSFSFLRFCCRCCFCLDRER